MSALFLGDPALDTILADADRHHLPTVVIGESADECIGCPGRPGCCWNQATDCCYGTSHRCNVCW